MIKKLELSGHTKEFLSKKLNYLASELKKEMELAELSTLRVSIDLNKELPGPIAGIRVVASRVEHVDYMLANSEIDLNKP